MLSYNERGIRKLQENFTCFHDKLAEEHVYQSFLTIVGKSKKFAKPEVKVNLILRVRLSPARMITDLEKISVIGFLGSQDFPTQIVDHQDCRKQFCLDVLSHFSKLTIENVCGKIKQKGELIFLTSLVRLWWMNWSNALTIVTQKEWRTRRTTNELLKP